MDKELKKIKKLYGEAMMHFCRDNFALILDTQQLLLTILTNNFNPTHELYHDLEKNNLLLEFKEFIFEEYHFIKNEKKEEKEIEVTETPKELMAQAGYDLYECFTEDDIQKFRKYYARGEELCTFRTNRLKTNRVFFAVKKNVEEIKRENFPNPSRQDEYGTSVISIQFTKDGTNTLSIKNRYNHTVFNPDATFSNNLENIIPGLTKSFEVSYGLKQFHENDDFEIPGYVQANDGKYYKFNYEINNIYYCPDNIIIDNFKVKKYEKEKYLILDYFVLDLVNKELKSYYNFPFDFICDSFPDYIDEIEKIEIINKDNEKIVLITPIDGEIIEIGLDKLNRIISYKNNNIKIIYNDFLYYNDCLNNIKMDNVKEIGAYFLYNNHALEKLSLPKLEEVGQSFMRCNRNLETIDASNLSEIGNYFLESNDKLKEVNFPNLKKVGKDFLLRNKQIKQLYLPKLETTGSDFLCFNQILEKIEAPNLKEVGKNFLVCNKELQVLDLPNLKQIGYSFLEKNNKLFFLNLPSLETIDSFSLSNSYNALKIFRAFKLREIEGYISLTSFYENHPNLEEFVTKERTLKRQRK